MKVYELMGKLSQMPAGAEVRVCMIKSLPELDRIEPGTYSIDFEVHECINDGDAVHLDGWAT